MDEINNKMNEKQSTSKKTLAKNGMLSNEATNVYIEELLKLNEETRLTRRASLNALEDAVLTKEDLRINEERMRGLKEAFQEVINGGTLEQALHVLTQIVVRESLGEARTAFYTADPEGLHLHTIRGAGNMPESYANEIDGFSIGVGSLACGLALPTGRPVVTADVNNDPLLKQWAHIAQKFDYRGCWSFPIKSADNKAMGTFAMYFRTPREASQKDMELADIITKAAAIIITNYTQAEDKARAEKELYEVEVKYRNQLQLEVEQRAEEIIRLNAELKHLNTITANNYAEALRHVYINLETIIISEARNLSNSSRANLRRAQSAVQKMKLLTNDITNYLELYDIELKKEKIYPNNILQNVVESLQKKIEEANAKINIDTMPSLQADPVLFSKLMTHLLDNAIKFRKENAEPVINIGHSLVDHIADKRLAQVKPFVRISISDNGIGCRDNQTIFELFTQLDDHGKHKGSGMGLAICKKIMEMHGGFITCDSQPEEGARFSCYFPVLPPPHVKS